MTNYRYTPEAIQALSEQLDALPSQKQTVISRKNAIKALSKQIKELHHEKEYDVRTIATILKNGGLMITHIEIKNILGIKVYDSEMRKRVYKPRLNSKKTTETVSEDK